MTTPAVDVDGLVRRFGQDTAVDGISFRVDAGEVFGFLGPNGAGKSTTQRILCTLLLPSDGSARVFGHDVAREAGAVRRRIGRVPEDSSVYTELTGLQNLRFTGRLYRIPREERERRVRGLLEEFALWEDRHRLSEHYSKGMTRRLALAMGLIHRPDLLFLDEPTAGLDAWSRQLIHDRIRELNRDGTTIFLTTHHIEEAARLCGRVAIIHHGRIAAIDTPGRLRGTLRRSRSVEVSFASPPDPSLRTRLEGLPGVDRLRDQADGWRLYTEDPPSLLPRLMEAVEEAGSLVETLHTREPSLEEVFLAMTSSPRPPDRPAAPDRTDPS